jgi:cytochrome b6-f complex iron-sulfur subunit
MAPDEKDAAKAAEGGEGKGPGEPAAAPKTGSKMTPEEKAAAIEAAKAKAAAAKAAKEAAAKTAEGAAPAPAAAGEAAPEAKPAAAAAAPAEAKPAAAAAAPAAAAKPAKPAEKEPEIRPGRQVAGGVEKPVKKGEPKPSKEEIIAKALEKIRATEAALAETHPPGELTRRQLFKRSAWVGFGAFMAFLGGCFGRFFFPRVLFEPLPKFKAGYPQEYTIGQVSTKYKDTNRVWIIREATGFYAVFARCTHLGCTPMWLDGEQKFKCPCHGSGYTKEGINYEGPAPRPMERCWIKLGDDGQIVIDTGTRFRYEEGQWDDERAYMRFA